MAAEISQVQMAEKLKEITAKSFSAGVPTPCREGFLCEDDRRVYNEQLNWLQELQQSVPIWSRLRYFNCMGQQRHMTFTKDTNYDIEIPKRLYSLWGNTATQTEVAQKVQKYPGYGMVNNVLACCVCLKYNLNQWSSLLLDDIVKSGSKIYTQMMKFNKGDFEFNHLNHGMYELDGTQFRAQLTQVASGFLYIPYGHNEFNLARALMWFFKTYQFGLLHCQNRCVAFGFAVDMEHGFFMYDCQSGGMPLFGADKRNSYVLRTNHLQILLYCLLVTLNVSKENEKFWIYSVDAQIEDFKVGTMAKKSSLKHSLRNQSKLGEKKMADLRMKAGNDRKPKKRKIQRSTVNQKQFLTSKSAAIANNGSTKSLAKAQRPNDHNFWKINQSILNSQCRKPDNKQINKPKANLTTSPDNNSKSKNCSISTKSPESKIVGTKFKSLKGSEGGHIVSNLQILKDLPCNPKPYFIK